MINRTLVLIGGLLMLAMLVASANGAQQTITTITSGTGTTGKTLKAYNDDNLNPLLTKIESNRQDHETRIEANKAAALVGDCTVGPCLDGTSDGGNIIKLWAGTGSYWTALQGGSPAANRSWRLPIAAAPAAGETLVMTMDQYGQMSFLAAPETSGYVLSSTDAGVLSWKEDGGAGATAGVSDTAYSASTWDGVTDTAPSKNAVRDVLETKANASNISFVAGALSDMKILTTANPSTGETMVNDTYSGAQPNLIINSKQYTDTKAPAIATEVNGASSATLTAAQVSSTIVYNTGMGGADVALTLPTAAAGYTALFTVGTAQSFKWGVRAGTNDKIYLLAADGTISAGDNNGYARMTAAQVGQSFACWTIKTDAYDWQCKSISIGTSTFAAN